jgi:hypothetical protein
VEQGVENTGPLDMLGTPDCCVKAGASTGLNDSDAGSWREELYGSGWSSSTGVGVGVTLGARELDDSVVEQDSDARTGADEWYESGWCLSAGVGMTLGAVELGGSIVAPGVTRAKLGSAELAGSTVGSDNPWAARALTRRETNVECNMLQIGLIYRVTTESTTSELKECQSQQRRRKATLECTLKL